MDAENPIPKMHTKVFTTVWTEENIDINPVPPGSFLGPFRQRVGGFEAILPLDIPYRELKPFIGKKTRVTIEQIPWDQVEEECSHQPK